LELVWKPQMCEEVYRGGRGEAAHSHALPRRPGRPWWCPSALSSGPWWRGKDGPAKLWVRKGLRQGARGVMAHRCLQAPHSDSDRCTCSVRTEQRWVRGLQDAQARALVRAQTRSSDVLVQPCAACQQRCRGSSPTPVSSLSDAQRAACWQLQGRGRQGPSIGRLLCDAAPDGNSRVSVDKMHLKTTRLVLVNPQRLPQGAGGRRAVSSSSNAARRGPVADVDRSHLQRYWTGSADKRNTHA